MNFNNLPKDIQEALINRGHSREAVKSMTPKYIFEEYCNWHGLINWGGNLWDIVKILTEKGI